MTLCVGQFASDGDTMRLLRSFVALMRAFVAFATLLWPIKRMYMRLYGLPLPSPAVTSSLFLD